MKIKKIESAENIGIFKNFTWNENVEAFKQFNFF